MSIKNFIKECLTEPEAPAAKLKDLDPKTLNTYVRHRARRNAAEGVALAAGSLTFAMLVFFGGAELIWLVRGPLPQ